MACSVFLRVEAPRDHGRVAERGQDPHGPAGGVEDRRHDYRRLVLGQRNPVQDQRARERGDLGSPGALRQTGRAAGQDDEAGEFRGQRWGRRITGGDDLLQDAHARGRLPRGVDPGQIALLRGEVRNQIAELLVVEHRLDALAFGDLVELRLAEPGVHHGEPESGAAGAGDDGEQSAMIARDDADDIALAESVRVELVGDRVGPGVEFGEGQHAGFVDDRGLVAARATWPTTVAIGPIDLPSFTASTTCLGFFRSMAPISSTLIAPMVWNLFEACCAGKA